MFLKEFSHNIIKSHGKNLADIAVIFPNKRASLWMNDYLLEAAEGSPVFAPRYFSISEFFQKHSRMLLADHIQLVSILHKSYCRVTGEKQTLDQFYAWGEILLADFDSVDKSLADTDQLFHNIGSLHEMDSIDYLSDPQKELLEHFFNSFTRNHESVIQQKFIALWNNLHAIYTDFKLHLTALGIAYEGMLYRDVVERVDYADFSSQKYYFVGFHKLLDCEERLLAIISDKAIKITDKASISDVSPEASITIAQSLTDDLQARFIESWLRQGNRIEAGRKTAIVLCDEHLLPSAIHGLPDNVGPVNITAGFPLAESQPASFIATLLELYTEGVSKDGKHFRPSFLRNLQSHPLYPFATNEVTVLDDTEAILTSLENAITSMAINTKHLTQNTESTNLPNDQLLSEAIFRVYTIITRLKSLYAEGYLDIEPLTLSRLFRQIILTATIPFHGEPAKGVQIMGMLETRNLDFDHLLILSCNEGKMPQTDSDTSVIPYAMKKAFSINTADDRTNIQAYHFHRLLKRCNDVTLVYNSSSSDTSPGEMSRFLLNLIVNRPSQVSRISLQTDFRAKTLLPQPVDVTPEEQQAFLDKRLRKGISPSAINTFFRCQKRFYYEYYRELREEKDEDDTLDGVDFGTIFHGAAEAFYGKFVGERITADMLTPYINTPELLDPFVNQAFLENAYGGAAPSSHHTPPEPSGTQLLYKNIVRKYLKRLLVNDRHFCPFTIVSLEQRYSKRYQIPINTKHLTLNTKHLTLNTKYLTQNTESPNLPNAQILVGGVVDRLDMINDGEERLRVVDYKTGQDHSDACAHIQTPEDIFSSEREGAEYYRQTFLYSIAISEDRRVNPRSLPVAPALIFIRNKTVGDRTQKYDPILKLGDTPVLSALDYKSQYEAQLLATLREMLTATRFSVTDNPRNCQYCPFAALCRA